jgi:ankyrin repeat protein
MPTNPSQAPRPLPDRPNLRHLKDQAKDLLKSGQAESLAKAQFQIARLYGFASWVKLKTHVESLEEIGQLKAAIDTNDLEQVKKLMTKNPALHRAPLGYGKDGPLTWVAECRIPRVAPGPERLAIAQWMIDNGSDVHQGSDGPLMRAALYGMRIPMMDLLLANGADVNAQWHGRFPIIFAPCETIEPTAIQWLLVHGADPNIAAHPVRGTALDYLLGGYVRSDQFAGCIDILLNAGCKTLYDISPVFELLRGRLDQFIALLDADPDLIRCRFPNLDIGATGARRLTLKGATLLHVAAEFGNVPAAQILLDRGADVNARADIDEAGVGGQTPIFHAVTQFKDWGLPVTKLLLDRGADLSVRAKLPGHYERLEEILDCTPLGYARLFPEGPDSATRALLIERGAPD